MLALMTFAGLGAAVPQLIRSTNSAEWLLYQAITEHVVRMKSKTGV